MNYMEKEKLNKMVSMNLPAGGLMKAHVVCQKSPACREAERIGDGSKK